MNDVRKKWVYPQANVERFVANDYVSACGDTGYGDYLFECNAGRANRKYDVVTDSGDILTEGPAFYSPCGEKHAAPTTDDFQWGYISDGWRR